MRTINKLKDEGSALVITLLVIFAAVACIGTAVHVTTTTVRQTDSSRDFSTLRNAAEGALDFAYGIWVEKVNTTYGPVSNKALSDALATVPSFSTSNGLVVSYDTSAGYSGPQITGIDLAPIWQGVRASDHHHQSTFDQSPSHGQLWAEQIPGLAGNDYKLSGERANVDDISR